MGEKLKDHLVITNETRHLILVRDFIARLVHQGHLAREVENKIILAVDEAVTNIIEHGFERGEEGNIEVEVEIDEAQFRVIIRDSGRIFNPESVPDPDMKSHIRGGRKKGLGIFLMRQIMDEVRYAFRDGVKNELTLVKYVK